MIAVKAGFVVPVVAALALSTSAVADADVHTEAISTTPASYTPWLLKSVANQYVRQIAQCGDTVYAVGTISAVGQGGSTYSRGNAFSFSASTGAVTSWDPQVDGQVLSVALSPDCATAYLGGAFHNVHGTPADNIVAVDTTTGAVRPEFAHDASTEVDSLLYTRGTLLVGGTFIKINDVARQRFASLDPHTGAVTSYANLPISGEFQNTWTRIYKMQLSHDGSRLLVEGVFKEIAGQSRQQVAMLDLGSSSVTLNAWHALELNRMCRQKVGFYARDAAWSPDDQTVYVASTGHKPVRGKGSDLKGPRAGPCDAAIAFPSRSGDVKHTWINYTGCDSLYAITADDNNVYVTGHERWADNPLACEKAGPGSQSRPGLGSLDVATGKATSWNPTRSLGHGGDDLLMTDAGLWVASDNFSNGLAQMCGGQTNHGGLCFLPAASGP